MAAKRAGLTRRAEVAKRSIIIDLANRSDGAGALRVSVPKPVLGITQNRSKRGGGAKWGCISGMEREAGVIESLDGKAGAIAVRLWKISSGCALSVPVGARQPDTEMGVFESGKLMTIWRAPSIRAMLISG